VPAGPGHEVSIDSGDAPDIVENDEAVAASRNHPAGLQHRARARRRNQFVKLALTDETEGPYAHLVQGTTMRRLRGGPSATYSSAPMSVAPAGRIKYVKDQKLKKVQASIQADQVRVSSPSKDELQAAMQALREHDFGVALQFGNYR